MSKKKNKRSVRKKNRYSTSSNNVQEKLTLAKVFRFFLDISPLALLSTEQDNCSVTDKNEQSPSYKNIREILTAEMPPDCELHDDFMSYRRKFFPLWTEFIVSFFICSFFMAIVFFLVALSPYTASILFPILLSIFLFLYLLTGKMYIRLDEHGFHHEFSCFLGRYQIKDIPLSEIQTITLTKKSELEKNLLKYASWLVVGFQLFALFANRQQSDTHDSNTHYPFHKGYSYTQTDDPDWIEIRTTNNTFRFYKPDSKQERYWIVSSANYVLQNLLTVSSITDETEEREEYIPIDGLSKDL